MPTDRTRQRRLRKSWMSDFALDNFYEHRIDREARVLYVGGDPHDEGDSGAEPGVTHHMADRFDMGLFALTALSEKDPITIYLASCGGNWEEGMQMAGALSVCPCPTTVIATKHARSMTSIIPLFADRFLLRPPAQYMIHYGTMDWNGQAGHEFETMVAENRWAKKVMVDIYQTRLKEQGIHVRKSPASIRAMIENKMRDKIDVWLTPDEAVEYGFADGLFTGSTTQFAKRPNRHRRALMAPLLRPVRDINIKGVL